MQKTRNLDNGILCGGMSFIFSPAVPAFAISLLVPMLFG